MYLERLLREDEEDGQSEGEEEGARAQELQLGHCSFI
jgi:hypothetical protein